MIDHDYAVLIRASITVSPGERVELGHVKYVERLRLAVDSAQAAKRGLWATSAFAGRSSSGALRYVKGILLAGALAVITAAQPAAAQKGAPSPEPPVERYVRGGVGLLIGTSGLGAGVDFSVNSGTRLYRGRLTIHDNTAGATAVTFRERITLSEAAVMLGRGHRFNRNYGSVAAGVALVGVSREGGRDRTTPGVPVEAQLISGGPLRLGAALIGNVNLERPFAAFLLSVQIGRVP